MRNNTLLCTVRTSKLRWCNKRIGCLKGVCSSNHTHHKAKLGSDLQQKQDLVDYPVLISYASRAYTFNGRVCLHPPHAAMVPMLLVGRDKTNSQTNEIETSSLNQKSSIFIAISTYTLKIFVQWRNSKLHLVFDRKVFVFV